MSALSVNLPQFEGPLALLLFLIRKEEMDIYDIEIHKITKHYLDHIKLMKELDLEVASDFIQMAATLIHIKSKMLLPKYEDNEDLEEDDPRKHLVQRLLEYQKYQEASIELYERPLLGRDLWRRGVRDDLSLVEVSDVEVDDNGLFQLIHSYNKAVKMLNKRVHKVALKAQSISQRIMELRKFFVTGEKVTFKELFRPFENTKTKIVVTFISLLELAKLGFLNVYQSKNFGDIYVEALKDIEEDAISRVESYDSAGAANARATLGIDDESNEPAIDHVDLGEMNDVNKDGNSLIEVNNNEVDLISTTSEFEYQVQGEEIVMEEKEFFNRFTETEVEEIATNDEILAAEAELGINAGAILEPQNIEFNKNDMEMAQKTIEQAAKLAETDLPADDILETTDSSEGDNG